VANISQVRGALLEEAVLYLLEKFGYETIESVPLNTDESLRGGHSGLEVRGRGTWHQIDALAGFLSSPAFMYPLRLMVEAKCYQEKRPVGIEVVRNAVGVLKDISENYFSIIGDDASVKIPRFNYHSAIFSTSGYTSGTVNYALAHQVFLIQYENVPVIQPLINSIMNFDESCITGFGKTAISEVRRLYRDAIRERVFEVDVHQYITPRGLELINTNLVDFLKRIRGSYFGMLQGRWPLHLLTSSPLPPAAFKSDTVRCHVVGRLNGEWRFTPANYNIGDEGWFELEFNIPDGVANLIKEKWGDREAVANIKQEHFSYIYISGIIGGVRRNVRLELDQDWINEYIERSRRRR